MKSGIKIQKQLVRERTKKLSLLVRAVLPLALNPVVTSTVYFEKQVYRLDRLRHSSGMVGVTIELSSPEPNTWQVGDSLVLCVKSR